MTSSDRLIFIRPGFPDFCSEVSTNLVGSAINKSPAAISWDRAVVDARAKLSQNSTAVIPSTRLDANGEDGADERAIKAGEPGGIS